MSEIEITAFENGPYVLEGRAAVRGEDGAEQARPGSSVALCRCGRSGSAPFCDGTHRSVSFEAEPLTLVVRSAADCSSRPWASGGQSDPGKGAVTSRPAGTRR